MFDRKSGYGSFMISGLDWTGEKLYEAEHDYTQSRSSATRSVDNSLRGISPIVIRALEVQPRAERYPGRAPATGAPPQVRAPPRSRAQLSA
jgi:hypothetical protein